MMNSIHTNCKYVIDNIKERANTSIRHMLPFPERNVKNLFFL